MSEPRPPSSPRRGEEGGEGDRDLVGIESSWSPHPVLASREPTSPQRGEVKRACHTTAANQRAHAISLKHGAAGAHGPDALDVVVAHADVPIVQVHGRIAVSRDQPDLLAELEAAIAAENEPAMLVGRTRVGGAVATRDERHAGIDAERFEARVS